MAVFRELTEKEIAFVAGGTNGTSGSTKHPMATPWQGGCDSEEAYERGDYY